ncbi:MAG: AAA family ATPase [Gammaproteobacteria bacterium]|nr:AAA family ATPase [Gammaproteobacteria bacterium]
MYSSFFGLNEKPFSITPDPRYLFMSARHGEALAHLVYGVTESGGFIQLTGEVGTGKTTLCRTLLLNRMPSNADVAVVLNPQLSAHEFLESICEELGITPPQPRGSIKALIDALNHHLLAAHAEGRRTILVVDEAQNLAPDVLEEVRLLTNLETSKQKLLQIILIGQPELRELLARTDLRQLAQRITGRYHLEPLSREETAQYIEHRLQVAGALGEVFDAGAKRTVYRLSQGIPRLINVICDRALLGAYSQGRRVVNARLVRRAAREISGEPDLKMRRRWLVPAISAGVLLLLGSGFWSLYDRLPPQKEEQALQPAVAAEPVATATPETAQPVVESHVSLSEQLAIAEQLTTEETALAELFVLWGLDPASTIPSCEYAATLGYSCLRNRSSWRGLQQLDHPAILELVDSSGHPHHVVLRSIDAGQAHLSIGGVAVSHDAAAVAEIWYGNYLLLWRPPNGRAISLAPGMRNSNVVWLRTSLAAIDPRYRAEPLSSDVYDQELEQRVRLFQREQRLEVDGLAGQQTQIIINTLLAADNTPRLSTPQFAQE